MIAVGFVSRRANIVYNNNLVVTTYSVVLDLRGCVLVINTQIVWVTHIIIIVIPRGTKEY